MVNLKGTGVAIVTPFKADGSVDFDALRKLVKHLLEGGINYLVVQGTTGEAACLSKEEKKQVLETVVEENKGKLPIIYGHGGNNTKQLADDLTTKDLSGADAILSVSPYYNKPTQEGIYQHYKMLARHTDLPIILYNVPGRTGSNISAESCLRLANDFENIIAVKEASGNWAQIMQIIKNKPEDFTVISGDDALTMPLFAAGIEGVISVTANAFPQKFSQMVHLALRNDFSRARNLHYHLLDFTESIFAENNPGGIKTALEALEICGHYTRLPITPVSDANKKSIIAEMEKLKKI